MSLVRVLALAADLIHPRFLWLTSEAFRLRECYWAVDCMLTASVISESFCSSSMRNVRVVILKLGVIVAYWSQYLQPGK